MMSTHFLGRSIKQRSKGDKLEWLDILEKYREYTILSLRVYLSPFGKSKRKKINKLKNTVEIKHINNQGKNFHLKEKDTSLNEIN